MALNIAPDHTRVSSPSPRYPASLSVSHDATGISRLPAHRCTHSSLPLRVDSPSTSTRESSAATASRTWSMVRRGACVDSCVVVGGREAEPVSVALSCRKLASTAIKPHDEDEQHGQSDEGKDRLPQ